MENVLVYTGIIFVLILVFGIGMDVGWYLSKRQAKRNVAANPPEPRISASAIAIHILEELAPKVLDILKDNQNSRELHVNTAEQTIYVVSTSWDGWIAVGPFWFKYTKTHNLDTVMMGAIPNTKDLLHVKTVLEYWLTQYNIPFNELNEENMTY